MIWLLAEPWMKPLSADRQYWKLVEKIGLGTGKAGEKP
jgi:hypothetical protein